MNYSEYLGASDQEEAISSSTAMDEAEFRKLLELFPRVRSRDYVADSVSSQESTSRSAQDELKEWQDAWDERDKREIQIQGIDQPDGFWSKLKSAAERKMGTEKADKFCKAFQQVHKKLVNEELSVDAAQRFINSS